MTLDFPPYPGYKDREAAAYAWLLAAMRDCLAAGGGDAELRAINAEFERRMILAAMPCDIVAGNTVSQGGSHHERRREYEDRRAVDQGGEAGRRPRFAFRRARAGA